MPVAREAFFGRAHLDAGVCIPSAMTLKHNLKPAQSTREARARLERIHRRHPLTQFSFCLPSLIILGVAKAGTDELRGWLMRHPNLTASLDREPAFFSKFLPTFVPREINATRPLTSAELGLALSKTWGVYASNFPVR